MHIAGRGKGKGGPIPWMRWGSEEVGGGASLDFAHWESHLKGRPEDAVALLRSESGRRERVFECFKDSSVECQPGGSGR